VKLDENIISLSEKHKMKAACARRRLKHVIYQSEALRNCYQKYRARNISQRDIQLAVRNNETVVF
jgi:hypothetical protein